MKGNLSFAQPYEIDFTALTKYERDAWFILHIKTLCNTDRETKAYKSKREILILDIIHECVQATWKIIQSVIPRE